MNLCFNGKLNGLEKGLEIFSEFLNFKITSDGLQVYIEKQSYACLTVKREGDKVDIRYGEKIHLFRAVGLLVERLREDSEDFEIKEEPQFTMDGVMFDVSQGNAVINIKNVKNILSLMAVMGLNMLMLYSEDSIEIASEPFFGYMRSKYTYDELKELDDYADQFGVEMIPCVQTLAHLTDALKWSPYKDMKDDDDTLLVDSPDTYTFVEKIIRAASAPFRSKRIHIGMDEAYKLGQGEYLQKNGLRSKFDIMSEHLTKVAEITDRLGLKPMIWSDMYFRAASRLSGIPLEPSSFEYYDKNCVFPPDIAEKKPHNVQMVYWDYYHDDEEFYIDWINRHREFGADPIFAGGLWSWTGFSVNYGVTIANSIAALNACKKEGIREVFTTIWGDDVTENNIYCNLLGLQLYAEYGYCKQPDTEKLKKRFAFCTGCNYDDFLSLSMLDEVPGSKAGNPEDFNPSKYLTWQDALLGMFDKNIDGLCLSEHYAKVERRMDECITRNGDYGFVFAFMKKLCAVLSLKAEIGLQLKKAYDEDDKDRLHEIAYDILPQITENVKELRRYHRDLFLEVNKPVGWEILDGRYGFLLARLDTAAFRVGQYLEGKIQNIAELEQERLNFQNEEGLVYCNVYNRMPSASRISITTSYMF